MPDHYSQKLFRSRYRLALAIVGVLSVTAFFILKQMIEAQSRYS